MGEELLVSERIDAGAEFIRDFNDYVPVSVACWIIPADSENLFLYVASDDIDDSNTRDAYGEAARRWNRENSQWLDLFQIKLVNSSDPIARQAMEIRDRFTAPLGTRYGGSSIGGTSIEGAYIYPRVKAMKITP